jgi:hypothetical protein
VDTGCHHLQPVIQARVTAILPHLPARDTVAITVDTFSWRASPTVGNAFVDDTDAAAATTKTSPPMVSHLCIHSIVSFIIRANVERLSYSSIYAFKRPSSSTGHNFVDGVINMGGSGEGESGGTGNDTVS